MGYSLDEEWPLQPVVETRSFIAAAAGCLTETERFDAISLIAGHPECGDLIIGGGGLRKVRFAIGGKGKRGGTRIIYYYHNRTVPIFLLTAFAKNERSDLTRQELQQLAEAAKQLGRFYGA